MLAGLRSRTLQTISMATSTSEWITWSQQFLEEQLELDDSIKTLTSTIAKAALPVQVEDLEASQLATLKDVKSLAQKLAATRQRWEQDSYMTLKGIAVLEQEVGVEANLQDQTAKVTQEQIRRLEENMIALERQGPSTSEPIAQFYDEYVIGLQARSLNLSVAEDLANTSDASSRRTSIQSYLETSVPRTNDWSAQAQQCMKHIDSADHFEHQEARQPGTHSHIAHLAGASNTSEPLSDTTATPTPV